MTFIYKLFKINILNLYFKILEIDILTKSVNLLIYVDFA